MKFKSYSQAGQDLFVHALLPITDGRFLDIGCNDPVKWSNSYGLERIGWTGILIDNDYECCKECLTWRTSPVYQFDAARDNYDSLNPRLKNFDYISLDCNGATVEALANLPARFTFSIITLESDVYRFGTGPRDRMRELLSLRGMKLICSDVCHEGLPFEDWFTAPELCEKAERFRSNGKDWKEILGL